MINKQKIIISLLLIKYYGIFTFRCNNQHIYMVIMNGEVPSVPITTLAGITSLTDCKYLN